MTRIEILPRNLPQFVDDLAKGVDAVFVQCLGEDFRTHGEEVVRRMQQMGLRPFLGRNVRAAGGGDWCEGGWGVVG